MTPSPESAAPPPGSEAWVENLYREAVALVLREREASISFLQRKLALGFNRGAALIERMEAEGVVSPSDAMGKREVLKPSGEPVAFPGMLPLYRSHKLVRAAAIDSVRPIYGINDDLQGAVLMVAGRSQVFEVDRRWLDRNAPGLAPANANVVMQGFGLLGGYFVEYSDGYTSWSPAEVFEQGYRLVANG